MEGEVGLVTIQWWTILLQILNTLILFAGLSYFLFKPVTKFLQERKDSIAGEYEAAENAKSEAAQLKLSYQQKIDAIKEEAQMIIRDATRKGDVRKEEIIKLAEEESKRIIQRAKVEVGRERTKAMDQLKDDMIEIALAAASRVIQETLDEDAHQKLIQQYIQEMRDVYV